jgi:hypothetical protein
MEQFEGFQQVVRLGNQGSFAANKTNPSTIRAPFTQAATQPAQFC